MLVPIVSEPRRWKRGLHRRKGGGGKGGGGGGVKSPVSVGGSSKSATSYGGGGGKSTTIPAGQLFAGRSSGGGTRSQVFGNQQYGSGYPGVAGRGVAGRGFPFAFWPLAWGGAAGFGTSAYLHSDEYGRPNNSSRPGGPMMTAAFISNVTSATTFRIIADNMTVVDLIDAVQSNCTSNLSGSSSTTPSTYEDSLTALPQPEQAIQYYRASTVSLTLDGYNNTGALGPDGSPNTPLPSTIDTTLLDCVNQTIGAAVPLIDGSIRWSAPHTANLMGIIWLMWCLFVFI